MPINEDDIEKKVIEDNAEWLNTVADGLDKAERISTGTDYGVEGNKIIKLSDELAKEISERLRRIANEIT